MENLDFRFSGSAKAVKITALTLPKPFLRESKLNVTAHKFNLNARKAVAKIQFSDQFALL